MLRHPIHCVLAFLLLLATSFAQAGAEGIPGQNGWVYPGWELLPPQDPETAAQLVGHANQRLKRHGVHLVVVLVPAKTRIHPEHRRLQPALPPDFGTRLARQIEALNQAGVQAPDLATPLLASRQGPLFHRGDSHWNILGARLAAQTVAAAILASDWHAGLPPPPSPPEAMPKVRSMVHVGDLVAQIPGLSPAGHKAYAETIQYFAEPGEHLQLFDTDPFYDTVIVGNSFAVPKWGFAQALALGLQRPVGLHYNLGNYGHWYGLLDYLRSPEFKAQHPRVLVWLITESSFPTPPESQAWTRVPRRLSAQAWLEQIEGALKP